MEVFPLDDATSSEIGNSQVSQVEEMKWDASFAHLEEMLQDACETENTQEHDFSNNLSPTLTTRTSSNQENKRKRDDSDSSNADILHAKLFCRSKVLSNELTVKIISSTDNSCNISNTNAQFLPDVTNPEMKGFDNDSQYSSGSEMKSVKSLNESKENSSEKVIFSCPTNINTDTHDSESVLEDKKCIFVSHENETSLLEDTETVDLDKDRPAIDGKCDIANEPTHDNSNKPDDFSHNLQNVTSDKDQSVAQLSEIQNAVTSEIELNIGSSKDVDLTINSCDSKEKDDHFDKSKKEDKKKKKFERCNIREIKLEDELDDITLSAQKEEQERIKRLQEAQMRALQERLQIIEVEKEALTQLFSHPNADEPGIFSNTSECEDTESNDLDEKSKIPVIKSETDVILLENNAKEKNTELQEIITAPVETEENVIDISSSSSDENVSESECDSDKKDDDVLVLSDEGEPEVEPGPDDPNNSGAHTNDCFNLPDHEGRVLVNVGHPPEDPDIYLAPQIAKVIKPHQIGGIRFLYDNVVENLERYKSSSGFGCILAHSMGLGKTVQVVSFVDVFLRHTPATLVLCIVPINTIQNWKAEFDMWVPATNAVDNEQVDSGEIRPRNYNVYTLNENFKTMASRASLIAEWRSDGGVLLMGYEMYRMLALRKMPKIPVKKGRRIKKQDLQIEPETAEQIKTFMDQMYEHIVIPGPDLVICDEGHRIKNSLASTSMALKSIKTRRRVVLTGYPLQNNLLEYWCMVDFVRPNYLGSRAEFCNMFERPISNGQCIDSTPRDRQLMRFRSHVLHSLLVGFVQRRGHSVLRAVLPKKEEHVLLIRMTAIQRKLYKCFVKDLLYVQQATNPLKLFAVCCKIWNHPDILYKLLQEKKAQEDIDLDIDLSNTASSSTGGSNALVKKKALNKDQRKGKGFQRPLKSQPVEMQGTEVSLPIPEPLALQNSLCTVQGGRLPIKSEGHLNEKSNNQDNSTQEHNEYSDMPLQMCKEEYPTLPSLGNSKQNPNHAYSPSSILSPNRNLTQSQYSQSSFCQTNYSQNIQQCQTSKNSPQCPPHQQYPLHAPQQNQQYLNSSAPQQQYTHNPPTSFSSGSNLSFPQQTNSSTQVLPQQNYISSSTSREQSFLSQTSNNENFHSITQFSLQNNPQQCHQPTNLQSQYTQAYSPQNIPPIKSHQQFNSESNNQFNIQTQTQSMNSQMSFNQTSQTPQQYNPTNHQQYLSQRQQFSPAPAVQYAQQSSQKFTEQSSGHIQYSDKGTAQLPSYKEQSNNDGQQMHDPSMVSQQFSDHSNIQQQFSQPIPIQTFSQSPASQSQFNQNLQTNRPQPSFTQVSSLESKSFSQPNSKAPKGSAQQHFSQQSPPQFSQKASPLQPFSQCSPSQSYSQHSPPLQQSPTQQQYSLPSPTQQSYSQFSQNQQTANHQQFVQQASHKYSQETAQPYSQPPYSHQQSTQPHSAQQQQFSHQTSKNYNQQFIQTNSQYPRQPSPQQHFTQQNRQQYSHQQYSQQSIPQFKSHIASQYPHQGNHSQYSPASQTTSQVQQFNTSASQPGNNIPFNQQTRQQFGSDQYSLQISQNNPQQAYNQSNVQSVSSPQFTQTTTQYSQSSPASDSPSFIQPPSPSSQSYSQQSQGGSHQGIVAVSSYQHPFSQPSNHQNKQTTFQMQYQSQPSSIQLPQNVSHSTHKNNSDLLASKGQSSSLAMCQSPPDHIDHMQNVKYTHQTFQNTELDKSISQKQSTKLDPSVSTKFQSSFLKQENLVVENIKEDANMSYPAKCPKGRPVQILSNSSSNLMQYQHGQISQMQTHDIKSDGEPIPNVNQDVIVTPIRERVDSSINYEWAIPIMKDYVLGVLENSHKMMVLFSIIDKTIQKGDKLLVFSQSLSTLDLLEHFLGKVAIPVQSKTIDCCGLEFWCRNKNYFRLDGSTSAQEREKLINEFNKNDGVSLFLLSTRAGCLGINLVGANRIVVMDASWNPCHDAQAVCRIYRYGQKKQCYIYRLVTDNSLEKRIYDRQVNKQGMSDRVVDELNPESNFTWKDVTTLIQDDEDDGPPQNLENFESSCSDSVLKYLVAKMSSSLSKEPFEHESLLLDRKDLKLTKQEKKLAKQSYEMAKRANMINIRTTYTYMPGGGQFIINNKQCQWVGGTTVRVVPGQTGRGTTARSGTTATPITASPSLMNSLFKQGVMVQKLTIPSTISIPVLTPGTPPVVVPAGQDVLVLRTPKGVYLRLPDGRIIAVQLPPSLLAKTQFRPNVVTHFRPNVKGNNQTGSGRGQSIGIIKQTLQCGGTVRYLGPKNVLARSSQSISKNIAPEVIDLSDDEDESLSKKNIGTDNTSEVDSEEGEKKPNIHVSDSKSNIFQGKQITIRRISPVQQKSLPSSTVKDKCDLPLKLQQNQQITIMPINPSIQQNRQKMAPQLAQPLRVQQMLLQPQQSKKKHPAKTAKLQQLSLPLNKQFQRQQITVTPAIPKKQISTSTQSFHKSVDSSISPKTEEQGFVNTSNNSSPSSVSITDSAKRKEVNSQVSESQLNSHIVIKDNSLSHSLSVAASLKDIDISLPHVTSETSDVMEPLSSISEMNQQISSLMSQNLQSSANLSHNQSILPSPSSLIPISISQNLPSSVSVTLISQETSNPLPQMKPCNLTSTPLVLSHDSKSKSSELHKPSLPNTEQIVSPTSILQQPADLQLPSLTTQLTQVSNSTLQHIDESSPLQKSTTEVVNNLSDSPTVAVPKTADSVLQISAKTCHESPVQIPKTVQQSSYNIETSQNGQLQTEMSHMHSSLSDLHHSSVLQPVSQSQQSTNSKKKKSRPTSKKISHSQLNTQNQLASQASETLHKFPHPLSDHFPHFAHPPSDFQHFPSYTQHKPILHIQHPQPLHPLQHSQEHSLAPHLPPMSHLYPMSTHMAGNHPSLSDIQLQSHRAWPIPQSSISSFQPFGQSSQYYSSDSNQFSFQPSSFSLPQSSNIHVSQSETNVSMTGIDHVSSSLSSEL